MLALATLMPQGEGERVREIVRLGDSEFWVWLDHERRIAQGENGTRTLFVLLSTTLILARCLLQCDRLPVSESLYVVYGLPNVRDSDVFGETTVNAVD
jgi:hypothetical protein